MFSDLCISYQKELDASMVDMDERTLQVRLKNCLQTILDLEPDLERLQLGAVLMKEFTLLKSFVERLREVSLSEEDVQRIERATEHFLDELRTPLGGICLDESRDRRIH